MYWHNSEEVTGPVYAQFLLLAVSASTTLITRPYPLQRERHDEHEKLGIRYARPAHQIRLAG
jgi:hypothetical protein